MMVSEIAMTARARFRRRPQVRRDRATCPSACGARCFSISTIASSTRMPVEKRDGKEADQVQRKSQNVHRPECREDRQRQRNRGDNGGLGCRAKNKSTMMTARNGAFEQRRDRGLIIALGEFHRGVDQLEVDIRIGDLQRGRCAFCTGPRRRPRRWRPSNVLIPSATTGSPFEAGEGPPVGDGVGDGGRDRRAVLRRRRTAGSSFPRDR